MVSNNVQGEVNKTHYVKTPGTKDNSSTPTAEKYERELTERLNKRGKFQITEVFPWGCVFGLRTDGNWAFYLQENATVKCTYITQTGSLLNKRLTSKIVSYAKPMRLNKVYPGGSSFISSMTHTVPVKITD